MAEFIVTAGHQAITDELVAMAISSGDEPTVSASLLFTAAVRVLSQQMSPMEVVVEVENLGRCVARGLKMGMESKMDIEAHLASGRKAN